MQCPDECPFLAPDPFFPCMFSCRAKARCSESNLNTPFPDEKYLLCSACSVAGCKVCSDAGTCDECHDGFAEMDGGCILASTVGLNSAMGVVLYVLIGLIVLLVLMAFGYCLSGSRSPNAEHNQRSIDAGRKHRHLSKVNRWDLFGKTPRTKYPLAVSNSENIMGMGIGLFYNGIRFMVVVGVLTTLSSYIVADSGGLYEIMQSPDFTRLDMLLKALMTTKMKNNIIPAVVLSPMTSCSTTTPEGIQAKLQSVAASRALAFGVLYVGLLASSLYFVAAQKRFAKRFDEESTSMSDFCVLLKGLPTDLTDEVALKKWAEAQLAQSRIDSEVQGVSIGYDFGGDEALKWEVYDMLDRFCSATEIEIMLKGKTADAQEMEFAKESLGNLKEDVAKDRSKAQEWFDGEKKLKGTGQAFLVMTKSTGKDAIMQAYRAKESLFTYQQKPIQVGEVNSEPPDICWENLGIADAAIASNEWKAVGQVLQMFIFINVLTMGFNLYVVMPYLAAGSNASGPLMTVNGIIMGIINGQLGGKVWNSAWGVGYHRKDRADVWLFNVNFAITLCNTFISLFMTIYAVIATDPEVAAEGVGMFFKELSTTTVGLESTVGHTLFMMLIPGQLFVNPLMGYLQGNIVPFLQANLVAKIIYVWKCLPEKLLFLLKALLPWSPDNVDKYERRNAENGMVAGQIGLPWDYSNLILNPLSVFFTFFFVSTNSSTESAYLVAWAVFFFMYSRFMHLRVQSVAFHSTHKLDRSVWMVWGCVPLALIGTCAMTWAFRAGLVLKHAPLWQKVVLMLVTYALSCLVWVLSLRALYPLLKEESPDAREGDFTECKREWIFSWFNCNPVFTLKCLYYLPKFLQDSELGKVKEKLLKKKDVWGHPIACGDDEDVVRYFKPGKEFLHFSPEKQKSIREGDFQDWLEFETYLAHINRFAEQVRQNKVNSGDFYEKLEDFLPNFDDAF
ncbi:gpmB [Symbiodinium sp. CCMP2592]|nr:gpmB [Symbiodinium sp. CCMP2592]